MFERKRSRSALSMGFERIACALGEDAEHDRDEMYINITDLKDIKTVIEKLGSNISKEE